MRPLLTMDSRKIDRSEEVNNYLNNVTIKLVDITRLILYNELNLSCTWSHNLWNCLV